MVGAVTSLMVMATRVRADTTARIGTHRCSLNRVGHRLSILRCSCRRPRTRAMYRWTSCMAQQGCLRATISSTHISILQCCFPSLTHPCYLATGQVILLTESAVAQTGFRRSSRGSFAYAGPCPFAAVGCPVLHLISSFRAPLMGLSLHSLQLHCLCIEFSFYAITISHDTILHLCNVPQPHDMISSQTSKPTVHFYLSVSCYSFFLFSFVFIRLAHIRRSLLRHDSVGFVVRRSSYIVAQVSRMSVVYAKGFAIQVPSKHQYTVSL